MERDGLHSPPVINGQSFQMRSCLDQQRQSLSLFPPHDQGGLVRVRVRVCARCPTCPVKERRRDSNALLSCGADM